MSVPEDLQAWFDLQAETLGRIHASWLPGIPPELLAQARSRTLGRRWLARRLITVSPLLFGLPAQVGADGAPGVRTALWLAPLLRNAVECALDLGSLALASTVRTLVTRTDVMKLRSALGAARYTRALSAAGAGNESPPPAQQDECDIVERLTRCGAAELAGYASYLHPAWGESVKLTFERSWWVSPPRTQLLPDVAEATLRLREHTS